MPCVTENQYKLSYCAVSKNRTDEKFELNMTNWTASTSAVPFVSSANWIISALKNSRGQEWAPHPGGGGVLPEKMGGGVRPASQNPYPIPYPIYDQNLRYSLPYLWPDF